MSKHTGRAGGMSETHYDILRIVSDKRGITNKAIMEMIGSDPRGHMRRLRGDGLIDGEERAKVMGYWITPTGKCLLSKIDGMGALPTPRMPISKEPFKGVKFGYIRTTPVPPSRRGDDLVEYQPPMIISSNVQAFSVRVL